MTPNRPYLIRALYDWILDNQMAPHLLVNAGHPGAQVPAGFVEDGRIVLNISPTAVRGLVLGNERIAFSARFGGVSMEVAVPPAAVLGIYARENGRGMVFGDDEVEADEARAPDDDPNPPAPPRERPVLKVVK
jgi:stringent starvation protein B